MRIGGIAGVDTAGNKTFIDVIGNKSDTHGGDSLYALSHTLEEHAHKEQRVYPELANPITLTKAAGAWAAYPAPIEIVPASTITESFDVHFVTISNISANGNYNLNLYSGGGGSEVFIGAVTFTRTANKDQAALVIQTPIIPPNTRISGALSSSNAAADTADVKIEYHTY